MPTWTFNFLFCDDDNITHFLSLIFPPHRPIHFIKFSIFFFYFKLMLFRYEIYDETLSSIIHMHLSLTCAFNGCKKRNFIVTQKIIQSFAYHSCFLFSLNFYYLLLKVNSSCLLHTQRRDQRRRKKIVFFLFFFFCYHLFSNSMRSWMRFNVPQLLLYIWIHFLFSSYSFANNYRIRYYFLFFHHAKFIIYSLNNMKCAWTNYIIIGNLKCMNSQHKML